MGDLILIRLSGADAVEEQTTVLAAGASFDPLPIADSGHCTMAYYDPDPVHPTHGSIALSDGSARVVGWRGTAPFGLSLLPGGRVALAAADPDWPGQVDLWWLKLGDGTCATPMPALTLTPAEPQRGVPLGDVLALDTPLGPRLVIGGLTTYGEVAFGAPESR